MNRKIIFEKLKKLTWTFQKNGNETIIMGNGSGRLAISFEEDGTLTFPNKLGFLPGYRFWKWDDSKQEILLLNEQKQVVLHLLPPTLNTNNYNWLLKDINSNDTFVNQYLIGRMINDLWAPTPLIDSNELISINNLPTVFTDYLNSKFSSINGVKVLKIDNEFTSLKFWEQVYEYLITHPMSQPICVTSDNELSLQWLNNNDLNSIMVKQIPNYELSAIWGPRELMVELIGEVLSTERQLILKNKTRPVLEMMEHTLKNVFAKRYIKYKGDQ